MLKNSVLLTRSTVNCARHAWDILRAALVCRRWESLITRPSHVWSLVELLSGSTMFGGGQWQRQLPVLAFLRRQCEQIEEFELSFEHQLEVRMLRNGSVSVWALARPESKAHLPKFESTAGYPVAQSGCSEH